MTKSETQKYVMELREENAKLREENERIRQNSVSHEVYNDLLEEYVDLSEENEKLKQKLGVKENIASVVFGIEQENNYLKERKYELTKKIARLREKEVAKRPTLKQNTHDITNETIYMCPRCGSLIKKSSSIQVCKWCNQKLDWSEEE